MLTIMNTVRWVNYILDNNRDDDEDEDDDEDTTTHTLTTMMMRCMTIELKELALFIIELSVHDYYFVMNTNKSSVIALAALLNAAQLLIDFSSFTPASSMMLMRMLMRKTTGVIPTREAKNDDYIMMTSSTLWILQEVLLHILLHIC